MHTMSNAFDDLEREPRQRMSLFWRLVLGATFFGPAVCFSFLGDYVLSGICAVTGMAAFSGYRMGAVSILASVGAFAAAIAFAPTLGVAQELRFGSWFGTTGLLNRFASMGSSMSSIIFNGGFQPVLVHARWC